jgi:trigger factor
MKVNVEELSSVERRLTVEIPSKEVDKVFNKIYNNLKKTSKIKGFRPGKVPRPVLERYYGDQAKAQAAEDLVSGSYNEALQQAGLEPRWPSPSLTFRPPRLARTTPLS